jgi:Mannosyltransferase (PIG-V)
MPAETVAPDDPRLPLPLRVADIMALALAAVALWIAFVGGRRYLVFGIIVSLRSALPFVYAAASVLIVRHVLRPRPSALDHLVRARGWGRRHPDLAIASRAFLATRPTVLLIGFFAVVTFGIGPSPGFAPSPDPLANLPARFDAGWYAGVALDGYSWDHSFQRQRNIAFFPALPLMMRPVAEVLGFNDRIPTHDRRMVRALWAGVLISLAAFLWALYYLVRLGRDLVGAEAAENAALLLAAYPFALFFSAAYTESVFLLAALGAFYHFRRAEWVAASAWGLLLGLTRPNGCFASVPLAVLGAQQVWEILRGATGAKGATGAQDETIASSAEADWKAIGVRLLVAAMPGIGMLLFTLYLHRVTGVWFAWARSHEAWGRTYQGLAPFATAWGWVRDEPLVKVMANVPFNTLNAMAVLFGFALTYPVFRRLGAPWGVFVLLNLVPPLFAGGVLSMGRLTSTLFPLFLALAAIIPRRAAPAWSAAFGVAQGLCAALFFTWRELF